MLHGLILEINNNVHGDAVFLFISGWIIVKLFPWFLLVWTMSFENTVGKGEVAHNEQFLLFQQCFLSLWRTLCHFLQIWNCYLQTLSVCKSLKFFTLERVKFEFSFWLKIFIWILNAFPNEPLFLQPWCRKILRTLWENEEIACNEQFLLFPQFFEPFHKQSSILHSNLICHLPNLWILTTAAVT